MHSLYLSPLSLSLTNNVDYKIRPNIDANNHFDSVKTWKRLKYDVEIFNKMEWIELCHVLIAQWTLRSATSTTILQQNLGDKSVLVLN